MHVLFFLWSAILTNIINTQGVFCLKKKHQQNQPNLSIPKICLVPFQMQPVQNVIPKDINPN